MNQRCNLPGFRGAGRFLFSLRGERQAFRRRDKSFDVLAPKLKRCALFGRVVKSVVRRRNAPDHAGPMVQNRLDYVRLNAKPGHAARGRAAKIVNLRPWGTMQRRGESLDRAGRA